MRMEQWWNDKQKRKIQRVGGPAPVPLRSPWSHAGLNSRIRDDKPLNAWAWLISPTLKVILGLSILVHKKVAYSVMQSRNWTKAEILSRVWVNIDRLLDRMTGFIAPYTFTARDCRQYSAIADLHTLQFTVIQALEFSVFISRILATDL
jgi:hypothetical protein